MKTRESIVIGYRTYAPVPVAGTVSEEVVFLCRDRLVICVGNEVEGVFDSLCRVLTFSLPYIPPKSIPLSSITRLFTLGGSATSRRIGADVDVGPDPLELFLSVCVPGCTEFRLDVLYLKVCSGMLIDYSVNY